MDYTEDLALTGYLIQKANDFQKLNFVFGRNNDMSLSNNDYTFHGSLTFD